MKQNYNFDERQFITSWSYLLLSDKEQAKTFLDVVKQNNMNPGIAAELDKLFVDGKFLEENVKLLSAEIRRIVESAIKSKNNLNNSV